MIGEREEARKVLDLCLKASRADSCVAALSGHQGGHLRFALGEPSTAGETSGVRLSVRCSFGRRTGAYTTNQTDPGSIEAAVRSAEALARLAPEDPEFLPPPGPQRYLTPEAWAPSTAEADAERRAALVAGFVGPSRAREFTAAGLCEAGSFFTTVATSAGLFAWHRGTSASLSGTVRTPDGRGSGWASAVSTRIEEVEPAALGAIATKKAADSAASSSLPPGRYTVVLEPAAVADLLAFVIPVLDARRTAEGRGPFSRPDGGSATGEKVAAEGVTLQSDPSAAPAPSTPFDAEGFPATRTTWVEDGILRALSTTRYWAAKSGLPHRPAPTNFLMRGGPASLEAMIKATDRGLLVTRFWYIRLVNPQSLLLTGLTRDGLFLIEKGSVAGAVRNFRFNESPLGLLSRADMLGATRRFGAGTDRGGVVMEAPALRSHDFNFTSSSDAV